MDVKNHKKVSKLLDWQVKDWEEKQKLLRLGLPVETLGIRVFLASKIFGYFRVMGFLSAIVHVFRLLFSSSRLDIELEGYEKPIVCRFGTSDPFVFYSVFIEESYKHVKELDQVNTILDAGAYTGYSALYLSKVHPEAKVVAVEPHPKNYEILVQNTSHLTSIIPIKAALMPKEGHIELETADGYTEKQFWGMRVKKDSEPTRSIDKIPAHHINTIMEKTGVEAWDILKIDIEGGERDLFDKGGVDLSSCKLAFIELHEHFEQGSSDSFFRACNNLDLDVDVFEENVIIAPRTGTQGAEKARGA